MVIEMDTMKMFPVLGLVVNNHTKGLLGIISNIEQFAILGTTISKFSQTGNTGRKNVFAAKYLHVNTIMILMPVMMQMPKGDRNVE